jgi:hypothetical protein
MLKQAPLQAFPLLKSLLAACFGGKGPVDGRIV